MSLDIELYRGDEEFPLRRLPLAGLLRETLREELAGRREGLRFRLELHRIEGPEEFPGPPRLINLHSEFGYVDVTVWEESRVVYRHPHSVNGLLGPILAELARRLDPEAPEWAFSIDSPALHEDIPRQRLAPAVMGTDDVDVSRSARLSFGVRPADEPEFPERDISEFLTPEAAQAQVNVLLEPDVSRLLAEGMALSDEVEEGGFLAGRVYRRADDPGRHVLVVQHVMPAEHTGASLMHFTFTGDSFRAMSRTLTDRYPTAQLIGWYHTHLFPASERMGLSQTDVGLHQDTFRRPWQVAALINLSEGRRVLRCYALSDGDMQTCPLWSRDEHGDSYRRTHPSLGRR